MRPPELRARHGAGRLKRPARRLLRAERGDLMRGTIPRWIALACAMAALVTTGARADELDSDLKLIRAVGGAFAHANANLYADAAATAELARHFDHTTVLLRRLLQKHQAELDADAAPARSLRTAAGYLSAEMRRFKALTREFAADAERDFDSLVLIAEKQADDAVRSRSPGLFEAARQSVVRAADTVQIMAALNGPSDTTVARWSRRVEALRANFSAKDAELRAAAVEQVRAPEDVYGGPDKEELQRLIGEAWTREYPDDRVVCVRLPAIRWERGPKFRWDDAADSWTISEVATLAARVVVRNNERSGTIYVAQLVRNTPGDAVVVNAKTKSADYPVQDILLERLR